MKLYGSSDKNSKHLSPRENAEPRPRPEAEGGKKPRKGLRRLLIALLAVVLVIAIVIIGYSMWEKPPEIGKPAVGDTVGSQTGPDSSGERPAVGEQPGESGDAQGEIPEEDLFDGALVTDRNDGIYTFLLVGRDRESNSTDTIIVGKFDTVKHSIDMINIPRDTMANVSWSSTPKKINAIYPGYTNSGKSGIEGLLTHVRNMIGFDVDFYAVVNLQVVEDVINEIGGVYFDVPVPMHYDDNSQFFHVHIDPGYQHLDGYEALGVFRFRYGGTVDGVPTQGYPGGDMQRIGVQQDLLRAIAGQMLSLGNIPNLGNVIQLALDNVETTLNASNMAFFARQFLLCSMDDINFHTAPVDGGSMINGVSYVSLQTSDWLDMLNQTVNPFKESITLANVNILTAGNYSGSAVSATNGEVAGGVESFFCQMCTSASGSVVSHFPGACPEEEEPPAEGEAEGGTEGEIGDSGAEETPPPAEEEPPAEPTEPETPVIEEVIVG